MGDKASLGESGSQSKGGAFFLSSKEVYSCLSAQKPRLKNGFSTTHAPMGRLTKYVQRRYDNS